MKKVFLARLSIVELDERSTLDQALK